MSYGIEILHNILSHKEILEVWHHNTLFSQTLQFILIHIFQKLEGRHKTGRFSRKFGVKEQFTAMAFIQLAARRSLCVMGFATLRLWGFASITGG